MINGSALIYCLRKHISENVKVEIPGRIASTQELKTIFKDLAEILTSLWRLPLSPAVISCFSEILSADSLPLPVPLLLSLIF